MGAILGFLPTLFGILGDLPKVIQVIEALLRAVTDAEQTGLDGPTKLANVLNDVEAAINDVNPAWGGTFDTIAKDVEGVVNEVVALFNTFAKPPTAPAA